jgi:hypothetical protein
MSGRSRETTVTFDHPFRLAAFDRDLPAGSYRLVTEEEEVLGLSFLAFQRTATLLQTPALSAPRGAVQQSVPVDQADLDAALLRDQAEEPATKTPHREDDR